MLLKIFSGVTQSISPSCCALGANEEKIISMKLVLLQGELQNGVNGLGEASVFVSITSYPLRRLKAAFAILFVRAALKGYIAKAVDALSDNKQLFRRRMKRKSGLKKMACAFK